MEVFPRGRPGHHDVRSVDRDALGAMSGHGIAEVDMLGDVFGWQDDGGRPSAVLAPYDDGAVTAHIGHGPAVAVADPATTQGAEAAVVAAGDDQITDRRTRTPGKGDFTAGLGVAVEDAPIAMPR
jgi:hypothetical protein